MFLPYVADAPFATKEVIDVCALAHGHLRCAAVFVVIPSERPARQKLARRVFSESRFKLCLNRQEEAVAYDRAGAFCAAIMRPVKSNDNENS